MTKRAISVTLRRDNLLWLQGQAQATPRQSVSETLDRLIAEARRRAEGQPGAVRSVVGTIRIAESDPGLARADAALRTLFANSPPRPQRRAGAGATSARSRHG